MSVSTQQLVQESPRVNLGISDLEVEGHLHATHSKHVRQKIMEPTLG